MEACAAAHHVQRWQHRADVVDLLVVNHAREVDDHAAIRIAKRTQELPRRRRRILTAQNRHSRQRLERAVVSFRVEHAHRVTVQDELLTQQARNPTCPTSRRPLSARSDRGRPARTRVRLPCIPGGAGAGPLVGRACGPIGDRPHVLGHGRGPVPRIVEIGCRLASGCPIPPLLNLDASCSKAWSFSASPTATALCGDRRSMSSATCSPVALLALGQHHDAAAIEGQDERQLHLPDDIQDLERVARGAVDETPSMRRCDAAPTPAHR